MNAVKKFAGYSLACMALVITLSIFFGLDQWSRLLASATNIKVTAWYTGGEVVRRVDHGKYEARIHRPVFDGLLWQARKGFMQIDWSPVKALPAHVQEEIDINGDGGKDFRVELDTGTYTAVLTALRPNVLGLEGVYRLKDAAAVRVNLKRIP